MKIEERALQAWSVLVLAAITRTILTYEELRTLTGLPNQSGNFLEPVYLYCKEKGWPRLSVLVVDKHTGKPRPQYKDIEVTAEQWRCFNFPWLEKIKEPVRAEDLAACTAAKAANTGK